jgi:hypothetical protein
MSVREAETNEVTNINNKKLERRNKGEGKR